ncbi:hypothetical protein [Kitasatospora sp. NPDC050543]|uniref:hypothetical protein n=1 Tax=Kitasatospora sp. NPDC050543 TaxID=3364054 RepID=UPI00378F20FA
MTNTDVGGQEAAVHFGPQATGPGRRPPKARYPLLLVLVGWAGSRVAVWADGHYVGDVLRSCHNSPGLPFFALAAAWAGLAASLTGVVLLVRLLVVVLRAQTARFSWRTGSLAALFPVVLLVLLVQVVAVNSSIDRSGRQHHPCSGLGPAVVPQR